MDLKDAQCSEVLPDRAPNCFSTDPPDHDQLSDTECISSTPPLCDCLTRGINVHDPTSVAQLARTHECSKLSHEAQQESHAQVNLRDVQCSELTRAAENPKLSSEALKWLSAPVYLGVNPSEVTPEVHSQSSEVLSNQTLKNLCAAPFPSSVALLPRTKESSKLPHEAQQWSHIQVDLTDVQSSELTRTPESPRLPSEAQKWPSDPVNIRNTQRSEVLANKAIDTLRAAHPEHDRFSNTKCLSAIPPQVDGANIKAPNRLCAAHPEHVQFSDKAPNRLSTDTPHRDPFGNTKCLIGASEINDAKRSEVLSDKVPKSLSAIPPEHDQLSDTRCLNATPPGGNNASTNVVEPRAQVSPEGSHDGPKWSRILTNLRNAKCNGVLPDKEPKSLNAAPTESDQLSKYAKFARPQVSPILPDEAQRCPSAQMHLKNPQSRVFFPDKTAKSLNNAPPEQDQLSEILSIDTSKNETPKGQNDSSCKYNTSAYHINAHDQGIPQRQQNHDPKGMTQTKGDTVQTSGKQNPPTSRNDALHSDTPRYNTASSAVHCQRPTGMNFSQHREGCRKKKHPTEVPFSTELYLQLCQSRSTLSPQNPGQGLDANPLSQKANGWEEICPSNMVSPIHHPELDLEGRLPPEPQPQVTNANMRSSEPSPKKPPQGRWITEHQVDSQLNPEATDRTRWTKPNKRAALDICEPTIPVKQQEKVCRRISQLRLLWRTQNWKPDPSTQIMEQAQPGTNLQDCRSSKTTLSTRQDPPHPTPTVNLGKSMNQVLTQSSSPAIISSHIWKHCLLERQPFIAPNSTWSNYAVRRSATAAA